MPLHSTDTKVRVCLVAVKRTKRFRLFLEHLGLHCNTSILLYQGNTVIIVLVKVNKIISQLQYIDIPLCYMCNEYNI